MAKEMRIKTHSDRLKQNPDLTPEDWPKIDVDAARVGWAVDILSNTQMGRNSVSLGHRCGPNSIDSAESMMLNCKHRMVTVRERESIVNYVRHTGWMTVDTMV